MILSYPETLKYLYENLPMFQRVGAVAIKKDLSNTLKLCAALGDPQNKFRSIHVAGTNGKGSTCHMLASVLQAAGYKTGLYTSPHLKEFTERIRVNGQEVSQTFVVGFVNRIMPVIEEVQPSFFEITVAMAFAYFAEEAVDVAVIETGLGGRLDSTNVITPIVSLITNISFDHTDLLGKTLPEIAREKAGIIKPGVPAVISERQPEVEAVFVLKARETGSPIFFASDTYVVNMVDEGERVDVFRKDELMLRDVRFPLRGLYQQHNIAGVVQVLDVIRKEFEITTDQLRRGLTDVVVNTGLKGRWQKISLSPTVVCDTGHNAGGIREVLRQLQAEKFDRLFIVWGMVKDKAPGPILDLLPKYARYYFCQADIPRALDAHVLHAEAARYGLHGEVIRDVNAAKQAAIAAANPQDLIFIGGSTYVVAEINEL